MSRSHLDKVQVIANTTQAVECVLAERSVAAEMRGRVLLQQEVQGRRGEGEEGARTLVKTEQQLVFVQAVEI